jgi:hypothetical protein
MTTRCRSILLLALLLVGFPGRLWAQEGGIGGIMDFIQRLSGPKFIGGGLTVKVPLGWQNLSLRLNAVHRQSFDESGEVVQGDDVVIKMWSAQPMLEVDLPGLPLAVAAGAGIHHFEGDVDPFTHYSVVTHLRVSLFDVGPFRPNLGAGVHLFPSFDAADFQPLDVNVARDGWEAVGLFFVGIDLVRF